MRRPINPAAAAASEAAVVQVRASRVMATNEDKSKAYRQTITKREYARLKAIQQQNQQTSNQLVVIKPFHSG